MAWLKIILISLLSINLHYGTFSVDGAILPHLENMFTALLLKDSNAFKIEFDAIRNEYFVDMRKFSCNDSLTSHEKIGEIFGINHKEFRDASPKKFDGQMKLICGIILGLGTTFEKLTPMDLMLHKTKGSERLEETLDEMMDKLNDLLIDENKIPDVEKLKVLMMKFEIQGQDFSINHCDDDYSLYRHLYIQFLKGFKYQIRELLKIQMMTGLKIWLNDIIPTPRIDPMVKSPDEVMKKFTLLINSMSLTSRIVHRLCDPAQTPVRDVDFIELEKLHQLVYMPQTMSNKGECEKIRGHGISGQSQNEAIKSIGCEGFIQGCRAHSKIQMCFEKDASKTPRTFKWIKTSNFSESSSEPISDCESGTFYEVSGESKTSEQCLCECISNYGHSVDSTFMFSRQPIRSDHSKNKVITGIQFVKKDKILYLEATEGELAPQGKIKTETNQALIANALSRLDVLNSVKTVHPADDASKIYHNDFAADFINLNDANNRLALTEGRCPEGQVVVGIKLDHIYLFWHSKSSIGVFVRCCKMNAEKGILKDCLSGVAHETWLNQGVEHLHGGWNHVDMKGKFTPLNVPNLAIVPTVTGYKAPFNVIEFQMSDREKDSGQTTVPLLDARLVSPKGKFPLKAIGLYHRGSSLSSGYVGFRVSTWDQKLQANL